MFRKPTTARAFLAVAAVLIALPARAPSATITITTSKDNTLVQSTSGTLSNGAGLRMFAGLTAQSSGRIRRALLAFNIAGNVPAGSTITRAQLSLSVSKAIPNADDFNLHRLTRDWGESTSHATMEEGKGITAATGDATWLHAFRTSVLWTTPGGDFVAAPSATTNLTGQEAFAIWGSTSQMVADVQAWLNTPATNFGWIIKAGEAPGGATAKRFDTRENTVDVRPALTITYVRAPGDMNCDGVVNTLDIGPFVEALLDPAAYLIAHPTCDPDNADTNFDGVPNGRDIPTFLAALGL